MFTEFAKRLEVISRSPVDIYVASNNPRYWYPYRLQHTGYASKAVRGNCLKYILDSNVTDDEVTNREMLDKAHEFDAHYVLPKDYLGDQQATTQSVHEFLGLYEDHPVSARPLIPLQPPHVEHYQVLSEFTHYALGGLSERKPDEQVEAIREFRATIDREIYVHALGMGASLPVVRALRQNPRLIDSFDLSSPEQVILDNTICDKTVQRIDFDLPQGKESTTVRAAFIQAVAVELNYLISPWCSDEAISASQPRHADGMDW